MYSGRSRVGFLLHRAQGNAKLLSPKMSNDTRRAVRFCVPPLTPTICSANQAFADLVPNARRQEIFPILKF